MSRSTLDHHLNKLKRPYIPFATCQVLSNRCSGSGEVVFKGFLPYMSSAAILVI